MSVKYKYMTSWDKQDIGHMMFGGGICIWLEYRLLARNIVSFLPVKLINVSRSSTRVSKLVYVSRRYYTCLEAGTRVLKQIHVSLPGARVSMYTVFWKKNIVYLHTANVRTWYVSYTILIRTLSVTFGLKITNSQNLVDLVRDGLWT